MNTNIFAAETNGIITHLSAPLGHDHAAQAWHRELGNPGTLVVLDLAEGQTPRVGDSLRIDADGVATLREEPEPLTYKIFDANPNESSGTEWTSTDGGLDADDYVDAEALASEALAWAVGEVDGNADYSVGDTLYVIVYRPDGTIVQDSRQLELDDFSAGYSDVTDWDTTHTYVACCYGTDGDEPGDCEVQVGATVHGAWYVRHGDDGAREEHAGPFATREEAASSAQECAEENNEACDGEDADAMRKRLLEEAAGEPSGEGEWCVYWETVGDDGHVVDRYETQAAAAAAAELANAQLHERHHGQLLCGYEARELVDGEWVEVAS